MLTIPGIRAEESGGDEMERESSICVEMWYMKETSLVVIGKAMAF